MRAKLVIDITLPEHLREDNALKMKKIEDSFNVNVVKRLRTSLLSKFTERDRVPKPDWFHDNLPEWFYEAMKDLDRIPYYNFRVEPNDSIRSGIIGLIRTEALFFLLEQKPQLKQFLKCNQ